MPYVDYDYYQNTYGGTVPEAQFPRMEKKAEVYLQSVTHGRLTEENAGNYEHLKDCICEMVDVVFSFSSDSGIGRREKKAETTDGYSVTYVTESKDGVDSVTAMKVKLYSVARMYLASTGLLSLKIPCCPTQI